MRLSLVVPAHNEAGNIGRLIDETYSVVPARMLVEMIIVDDASNDGTSEEVKQRIASGRYPGLRYMRCQVRCGQSAALRTGVLAATSTVIATMDGDGQNDPADIPRLITLLGPLGGPGAAMVGGNRVERKDSGSKRWASKVANWIRDAVLWDKCPDTGCGIKVYWRDAYLKLPFFTSMHRYLPALFLTYGYDVRYLPVKHRSRQVGRSKYSNVGRALVGFYDLIGVSWLRQRTRVPTIAEDLGRPTAPRPVLVRSRVQTLAARRARASYIRPSNRSLSSARRTLQ
jgi:dolichol-phosphate mannosyltransferase